jgi:hypothetical protein
MDSVADVSGLGMLGLIELVLKRSDLEYAHHAPGIAVVSHYITRLLCLLALCPNADGSERL